MNPRYAGIALLAVGKTGAGVAALALGGFVLAIALASSLSRKLLFASFGALFLGGFLGYEALSNEMAGTAEYSRWLDRRSKTELVTREASPEKFREATNYLWGGSLLGVVVAAAAFRFSRRSEDADAADF